MSQHDLSIANQGFPAFRSDLNDALQALGSMQSGTTAPSTTYANQLWYDTTNNIVKMRNEDNDAWISLFTLDQSGDLVSAISAATGSFGALSATGNVTLGDSSSDTVTVNGATTFATQISAPNTFGFKNRIINGAMMIDQRNAGASVSIATTSDVYTIDRWAAAGQSADGVFTVQQDTTAPSGFKNSMKITVTTADSSIGSSQYYLMQHSIEGLNVSDLDWGTANAQTVTLSFWVRSSLTGTFGGSLRGSFTTSTRSYPFTYTINSANTWEQKTITIAGDQSGTWAKDNSAGIRITLSLGDGSSRLGTANTWATANYSGATGQTNLIATNGATFYITGVQLEKGSTATSFDYRPYGTELALCQRYYWKIDGATTYGAVGSGYSITTTSARIYINHPVSMRSAPTYSYGGTINIDSAGGAPAVTSISNSYTSVLKSFIDLTVSSGLVAGQGAALYAQYGTANNYVQVTAEL